mmetsp:Transcript_25012/g.48882  ORF Transcript_25012/g.48882 Transcript_25012/m.48882 type:complete len:88 (+) Transcript_25012:625-888(+)
MVYDCAHLMNSLEAFVVRSNGLRATISSHGQRQGFGFRMPSACSPTAHTKVARCQLLICGSNATCSSQEKAAPIGLELGNNARTRSR